MPEAGGAGRDAHGRADAALAKDVGALGLQAVVTDTVMTDDASRARLAAEVLEAAKSARR